MKSDAPHPGCLCRKPPAVCGASWLGYLPLEGKGCVHRVSFLLKRWLLGARQGAVSHEHLDCYPDEFTLRFQRRTSRSRGKLFFRLVQQAVAVQPVPYKSMVKCAAGSGGS